MFFVIISETLITGTLTKLPGDETVQQVVRGIAADHASDEGRHHAYFRNVFEYVWPRLPRVTRLKVGLLLPDMILAFLQPDSRALAKVLQMFPDDFPDPNPIVREITASVKTRSGIRDSAAPTMRMLKDNGVLDFSAEVTNLFVARSLLASE